ncbi:MAG: sugar transferase, partial [Lachnospiraceae bacterium]|nr:sugar transferase [Lachnospiraceae bacterium]
QMIAGANGHKILVTKVLNPFVGMAGCVPGKVSGLVNKAFGNLSYEQSMSQYDFAYQLVSLEESILRTEQ